MNLTLSQEEQELVERLDLLTKQGLRLQVIQSLHQILKGELTFVVRPYLARIATRNHMYILGLRILHPVIRADREGTHKAHDEALITYANTLMQIGSLEEAQQCIQQIRHLPAAQLTEAMIGFAKWDYKKSIPILEKYCKSKTISPYQQKVGKINLLSAYVGCTKLEKAHQICAELQEEMLGKKEYNLLLGNSFELKSQLEILESNFEAAKNSLSMAEKFLTDQPGRYFLYVRKWQAVAELNIDPKSKKALAQLALVREQALQLKIWETVRDCDFHLARLTNNQPLLTRLLLGTPYRSFHERVKAIYNIYIDRKQPLVYCPGDIQTNPNNVGIDTESIYEKSIVTSTSWPLIQVINKDIYRPARMGVVFNSLYPDQYFDPFTSPQRVRNSVFRFNQWAANHEISFKIAIVDGEFHWRGPKGVAIQCRNKFRMLKGWESLLHSFSQKNNGRSFTCSEFANSLGVSPRTATKMLKKALESKRIEKIGNGRSTRYVFYSARKAS